MHPSTETFTVQVTNQNEAPVITNGTAITLTLLGGWQPDGFHAHGGH